MNGIAANMLLALTASVRFAGPLNTDLNDIIMNLVSQRPMVALRTSQAHARRRTCTKGVPGSSAPVTARGRLTASLLQVPFPNQHFLLSSLAPLGTPKDFGRAAAPRSLDQVGGGPPGVATAPPAAR